MKASMPALHCECGRPLSLEHGEQPTLCCDNPGCQYHGRIFRLPTVMLEEVHESASDH